MEIGRVTRFIPEDWTWHGWYPNLKEAKEKAEKLAKSYDTTKVCLKPTQEGYSVYKGPFTLS